MAITESMRKRIYERFGHLLGPDEAEALMEMLPPVGWADVATKRDIDALRSELRSDFGAGFDSLRAELYRAQADQTRTIILALLASNATIASLAFAAARLGG